MPRPPRFSEKFTPAEVARLYRDEGFSSRELERLTGISRWCLTNWCLAQGVDMREKDDAWEVRKVNVALAEASAREHRCCWPDCSSEVVEGPGRLCRTHQVWVDDWDGRGCCWPRCFEPRVFGAAVPACFFHAARLEGRCE